MLAEQRIESILSELAQRRAVSVTHLCQVTGASEATIRRDLNALARQGKLNKVHGGAVVMDEEFHSEELDMETKRQLRAGEKERIAQYAAGLIEDDDVVYLDAGSTVSPMADYIQATRALFITNSIECAHRLTRRGLRTYVLGGMLKPGTVALVGAEALDCLKRYHFTKAFLGTNGVTINQGFTTPDPEEAAVKTLAAQRAKSVFVLADASKFGTVTAAAMLPLEAAYIITDHLPDKRYLDYTEIKEV